MKILRHLPQSVQDIIYTVLGAFFTSFALKGFLVPNDFLDGGVTGASLLFHEYYHFNLGIIIVIFNIPFIIMGMFNVSRRFAIKTFCCVLLLALCLEFIPFQVVTSDKLLVSVFGGFFLGLGIGLAMRAGCSLDGLEVLALYTQKLSSFTISEIIFAFNVVIFLLAGIHFGLERALFAMLTYFVASHIINYVIEGLEEYTGVTIISGKSEELKKKLVLELGRGITIYKGERGFMKDSFDFSQDCDIIFTIITRLEVRRLRNLVHEVDHNAFIFTNSIKEAAGGVLKRKARH
jgi:uncharacterized membrane-anchored protein YitT (DUF2179 family)